MTNLELIIEIENAEQFRKALDTFPMLFKEEMFTGFQGIASLEEKILKSTSGFKDRTGKSRRSLFVVATWRPLGLEMGSFLGHMGFLAHGHGTWKGNWWKAYLGGMAPRVTEKVSRTLDRLVRKFNNMFKGM